jgi:SAM-dependent methyltransferase
MTRQRPRGAAACVRGAAESLPVATDAVDAAMAVLTLHHWSDWRAGLQELRRVARRRVVLLTFDAEASDFWLTRDYVPALLTLDRRIMPTMGELANELGQARAAPVLVPHDCLDGFLGAYWRRPDVYLDPVARRSMSSFAAVDATEGVERLASDLRDGAWQARNGHLLALDALDVGYRLLTWELDGRP